MGAFICPLHQSRGHRVLVANTHSSLVAWHMACSLPSSACYLPLSLTAFRSAITSFGPEASRHRMPQPQVATERTEPSSFLPSWLCRAGFAEADTGLSHGGRLCTKYGHVKASTIAKLISCHVCGAVGSSGYGTLDTA